MEWVIAGILGLSLYAWAKMSGSHTAPAHPSAPSVTPGIPLPAGDLSLFVQTNKGVALNDAGRAIVLPALAGFSITGTGVVPGLFTIANTGFPSKPTVAELLKGTPTLSAWIQTNVVNVIGAGSSDDVMVQLTQPGSAPGGTLPEQLAGVFPSATTVADAESSKTVMVLL